MLNLILLILGALCFGMMLLFIKTVVNDKIETKTTKFIDIGMILLMSMSLACLIYSPLLLKDLHETGAINYNNWLTTPIHQIETKTKTTQRQNAWTKKDLPKNSLVVLYKYECPDCEENYDLLKSIQEKAPTKYVESGSLLGKYLVKQYGVENVPSLLIWTDDNKPLQHYELIKIREEKIQEYIDLVNNLNKKGRKEND